MAEKQKPNIVPFAVISTAALPLLAAGIVSLSSPELLPWPPNPTITWSLIAVGGLMDVAAAVVLVQELLRVGRINNKLD